MANASLDLDLGIICALCKDTGLFFNAELGGVEACSACTATAEIVFLNLVEAAFEGGDL